MFAKQMGVFRWTGASRNAMATVQTLNIRVLFRHLTNYGK